MPESLQGREVVVAGGSGGIGAAVVDLLLHDGARLVIGYHSNRESAARWSNSAAIIRADLTRAEDRARLLDAAPSLYGIVVLTGDPARVADPSQLQSTMQRSHDVNYLGPILLAREA